ncbi:MAG: aminotransferase class V-fold PLP-dependent enzyme [Desulfobacterales bacterium]|nr:aminotransferase class V-fold PLP-dependent enzyme [Desulfobacterales bacterium]MDD4394092.1 aminotransferase class V-fold PLP-dependent enzyme [Desulfobacterales bacterium]
MPESVIYFDNAATSWPKPEDTLKAMEHYFHCIGASPGRSGHRLAIDAGRELVETRITLARLFNISDPLRIVIAKNATEALNFAVFGLLKPEDHVITSSMEHNSVMRPLREMASRGMQLSVIRCSAAGELDPKDIADAIQPNTRAIFLTHASNVTGTIMPVAEVGTIAKEHGLVFCVDAAQTAGTVPIDVSAMNIDLLAFTGHKSLCGPQGTGGLYIRKGLDKEISPLEMGGTGSRSEFEAQPDFMPDKYESGTPNTIGIFGLGAGARSVLSRGVEHIRDSEMALTTMFIDGLDAITGATVYGTRNSEQRISVVSFTLTVKSPSDLALEFDEASNIMCRPGLHCAPSAHRTIGTFPEGTVRFAFGYYNTKDQVQTALNAIDKITTPTKR